MSSNVYRGIDRKIIGQVKYYAQQLKKNRHFNCMEIEDLEQELMIEVFINMPSFDPRMSDLSTFTSKILEQRSKNLLRNIVRQKRINLNKAIPIDENYTENTDHNIENLDAKIDIDQHIERLPEKFRTICKLLKTHSKAEVAQVTGVSRSTISSHIKILKTILKQLGNYTTIQDSKFIDKKKENENDIENNQS